MGELIGTATLKKDGLAPKYLIPKILFDDKHYKVTVELGSSDYMFISIEGNDYKMVVYVTNGTIQAKLNYGSVTGVYANLEKNEIYLPKKALKIFRQIAPLKNGTFNVEVFKDGNTAPTESDGVKIL